jgi:hypothetical protein
VPRPFYGTLTHQGIGLTGMQKFCEAVLEGLIWSPELCSSSFSITNELCLCFASALVGVVAVLAFFVPAGFQSDTREDEYHCDD